MVETGESRTPRPEEASPEYATGLASRICDAGLIHAGLDQILRPDGNAIINDDPDLENFLTQAIALGEIARRLKERIKGNNGHRPELIDGVIGALRP